MKNRKKFISAVLSCTLLGSSLISTLPIHAEEGMAIYRLYNPNTGEHFYTAAAGEKDHLRTVGWAYEGTGWYGSSSGEPVYRIYNPNAKGGDHYYTRDHNEAATLVSYGWRWDNNANPVFYSNGNTNVYVEYNPNAESGAHNYTTSLGEHQHLLSIGWKHGEVAWKALSEGKHVEVTNNGNYDTVEGIPIINKKHPINRNYNPGEDPTAVAALKRLISRMQSEGMNVSNNYSGFRSYDYQAQLYNNYVNRDGQALADTYSARPGYSEHQSGLAFDLIDYSGNLLESPREASWLLQNAASYGFIVRYQAGKESITGYQAEPWHLRYIGDRAQEIANSGLTLEQFLGVEGGDYR